MRRYSHIVAKTAFGTVSQFGAAVREERTRAGLTQQELADRAHVSRRWLGMFENGKNLGAELSKVLTVVQALDRELAMLPSPARGEPEDDLFALLDGRTES